MKHKVGDKVRVRKDLKLEEKYGTQTFVEEMASYVGKEIEIYNIDEICICYDLKDDIWGFTDEMLED